MKRIDPLMSEHEAVAVYDAALAADPSCQTPAALRAVARAQHGRTLWWVAERIRAIVMATDQVGGTYGAGLAAALAAIRGMAKE